MSEQNREAAELPETEVAVWERLERIGALACDLLGELQPWDRQSQDVRSACVRLTMALAAVPERPASTTGALGSPPVLDPGVRQ